jgi:hypothetical protein
MECVAWATDPDDDDDIFDNKAGSLNVSLGATLANNSEIPMAGIVKFASVNFSAASSDVALGTIEVEKMGLGPTPAQARVWFERNGIRITGRATFTSDGIAIVSFAPAFVVKAGSTESLDLYVELQSAWAEANVNLQFKSAAMTTSALSVNGSFMTPVLRTANYTVAEATISSLLGWAGTGSVVENGMELWSFQITVDPNPAPSTSNQTKNAIFQSITLRQNGNGSLWSLSNIVLERNGEIVASNPVINNRDMTFSVGDEILDNTFATYYIKALINNVEQATDTYQFELRNLSDLNVIEANTSFRATIDHANAPNALVLGSYNIQGGDITFARDTSFPLSASYAPGTQEVVLMKGTLNSNTAMTLEDPSLSMNMSGAAMATFFNTIYMQIGNSTFSYSPSGSDTDAEFIGSAFVNGSANVKVRGTLRQTALPGTIKLGTLNLGSFIRIEYVSNGYQVQTAVGSIEGINVDVEASELNVVQTDTIGDTTIAQGSQQVTLIGMDLTSSQGNGVRVSRIDFDALNTSGTWHLNNVQLTLYVDGQSVQTKNVQWPTVFFDNFNVVVDSNNPRTMEVRANFSEAFANGDFQLVVDTLNAVDALTSQPVSYNTPSSAVFTIGTASAVVSASNDPILPHLLLSPSSNQSVMAFRVKAENDNVRLRDLSFTGVGLGDLVNFRIFDAEGNLVASANSSTSTAVTFSNISASAAPLIQKDATATYFLVANVKENISTGTFALTLTNVDVRASNGSTETATGPVVASQTHSIAEDIFVVDGIEIPTSQRSLSNAMRFTVIAQGKDSVTLSWLDMSVILGGYTNTGTIEVFRTNTNSANRVWYAEIASGATSVTPTWVLDNATRATVDKGTSATYIVRITGMIAAGSPNDTDWNITLNDVLFGTAGISAAQFDNVGSNLPIISQK